VGKKGGAPDVRLKLSALGYEGLAKSVDGENVDKTRSCFFDRLFPQSARENVSFFDIASPTDGGALSEFKCFFNHENSQFYIEAPSSAYAPACTRSSIVSLLELAEEVGAKKAFICLDKDSKQFGELARVFLYLGFELVDPRLQKLITRAENIVLMAYTIDNEFADTETDE